MSLTQKPGNPVWRPTEAHKARLEALSPRRSAKHPLISWQGRATIAVPLLAFAVYLFIRFWDTPGLRSFHPQMAIVGGIFVLILLLGVGNAILRRRRKSPDRKSMLHL